MKVIINEVPSPSSFSFNVMERFPVDLLKQTKTLTVSTRLKTKTRVCTSLYIGSHSSLINDAIEGFKTHEHREPNYFCGGETVSHYFVKSKAQNLDSYKRYLEAVCQRYFAQFGLDELTINLIVRDTF